jgi:hypothetical protein
MLEQTPSIIFPARSASAVRREKKKADIPDAVTVASIIPSAVMDLDATVFQSYNGTANTWLNLIKEPADGEAQSAYDMWLADGVTPEKVPDFVGTANDPAAYFSGGGGKCFQIKNGNTEFIEKLHTSSGSDFWVAIAVRLPTLEATDTLMATSLRSHLTTGLFIHTTASNTVLLRQRAEGVTINSTAVAATPGTDRLFIFSKSHSTNKMRSWAYNGVMTEANNTFDATSILASGLLTLLDNPAGADPQPAGVRLYGYSMGNAYLSNTQAQDLISFYETRHNRTYLEVV